MKAVILAGGLGTRLHPLTIDIPKPMVPILNRPLMSYTVELLAKYGFTDILALLYHQPKIIKSYFGDGKKFGIKIEYVEAAQDFGTAGAVKFACPDIAEPILVISADLLTDINLTEVIKFHRRKQALATMVLTRVENPLPYGIVVTRDNGRIKNFLEKPAWSEVFSDTINAGIYLLEPEAVREIPLRRLFDFGHDLFPKLLKERRPLYGYTASGYWCDIGKLEDYSRCHFEILDGKTDFKIAEERKKDQYLLGAGSMVAEQTEIYRSVIGGNCKIGRGAFLRECIVWDSVEIGPEARLERVIVTNDVKVGPNADLGEGVVVGAGTEIGAEARIRPFIKIWPRKNIEPGASVSRSMIWRERWTRSLFDNFGVTGICNVEITPQFAAALGAAYGSTLGKNTLLAGSRDSHKASRMIYRALVSGVMSVGANLANLEMAPIPVSRYGVRSLKAGGGFHVRKSPFDPEVIDIKFFDADGMDLSSAAEKKIERLFFAEDYPRAMIEEIGEITYPFHRVTEEYREGILAYLDQQGTQSASLKVVIDYSFGAAAQIFPYILGAGGLNVIALGAYIDAGRITKDQQAFEYSLRQMTNIVKSLNADFGVMLDTGGEKIFLCDEKGRLIDGNIALAIMARLALEAKPGTSIAVPVKESSVIEKLARRFQGRVVRTKNSFRGMMELAKADKISFVGENQGGYIYPDFMPSFDGMLSVFKLVDYLEKNKIKLSDLAAEIPKIILLQREVPCSVEDKGLVMRRMLDEVQGVERVEMIDGLKFWHDDDWVLIMLDAVRPIIHLYAEAASPKAAESLIDKYAAGIGSLRKGAR
ncbi:NTP transferase domain-containing protein [Candidatus Saganbacteria bacterium]|nr:NTP transferase domain-containing protein [Candidatus Saganbacteria bacterium]